MCGKKSGIFVLDIDNAKDGEINSRDWLKSKYLEELSVNPSARHHYNTLAQITGSGGLHLIYRYEPIFDLFKSNSRKFCVDGKPISMDIRSNGGQIVFAPSVHPNGKNYTVVCYTPPGTTTDARHTTLIPQLMPEWLLRIILGFVDLSVTESTTKPVIPKGLSAMERKAAEWLVSTPAENVIEPKISTPTVTAEADSNVYEIEFLKERFYLLKLDRFSDYDTWVKLLILMSNLSAKCEDPQGIREF